MGEGHWNAHQVVTHKWHACDTHKKICVPLKGCFVPLPRPIWLEPCPLEREPEGCGSQHLLGGLDVGLVPAHQQGFAGWPARNLAASPCNQHSGNMVQLVAHMFQKSAAFVNAAAFSGWPRNFFL